MAVGVGSGKAAKPVEKFQHQSRNPLRLFATVAVTRKRRPLEMRAPK
jgi:hypothetical protein